MIEIKRKNLTPLVFNDASTVKEAVQCAVNNYISLSGAELSGTDLSGTDLSHANFSHADLSHADLSGADLRHTYVSHANLSHADLSGADVSGADLSHVDLSYVVLSHVDLRGAFLINADLTGADIDFACWPLWCGSLNMKIDKKIFCQLLYHVLRAGKSVDDEEVKNLFSIPEIVKLANQFHRACECGKILPEAKTV
jgi:hypothetical protein